MKKIFPLIILLVSVSFLSLAQDKKKTKKERKAEAKEFAEADNAPDQVELVEIVMEEPREEMQIDRESSGDQPNRDDNEPYYMYEYNVAKDVSIVYKGNGYGNQRYALFTYQSRKKLTPFIFESVSSNFTRHEQAVVSLYGKSGVINTKGEVIIPLIYESLSSFDVDDQLFYIASKGGMSGIIDSQNQLMIPFVYEQLGRGRSSSLLFTAKQNGKYGLLNFLSKQMVLPVVFEELSTYGDYITAKKDGLYNYYGEDGQPLFTKWYQSLRKVDDEQIIARLDGKEGVISLTEKIIIPIEYEHVEYFYGMGSTYYLVTKNKQGMLKSDGTVAIPLMYDQIQSYQRDQVIVTKGGLKGILDVAGQTILPIEYDALEKTSKSIIVKKKDSFSLLSRMNETLLSGFSNLQSFYSDGSNYILASKNNKTGIYDELGKVIIAADYTQIFPTTTSSYGSKTFKFPIVAEKGDKLGMVDRGNKIVLPFEFDDLLSINSFLVAGKKNGMYGVFEIYNPTAVALPFKYDFMIHKDGKLVAYQAGFKNFTVQGSKITAVD